MTFLVCFLFIKPTSTFTFLLFFCLVKPLLLHYFHLQDNINKMLNNYEDAASETISLDIVKNYQQLSSRASWKRFSSVAGSPKTSRPRPTSSLSDDFHGKSRSNIRLDLEEAGVDGDWFVVLWLIRGCESMSIAADGAIDEGSENLWTIKNWWLFLIWFMENACVRQYIINNCWEQIDIKMVEESSFLWEPLNWLDRNTKIVII